MLISSTLITAVFLQIIPTCRNINEAPTRGTGTQFVTGACQVDSNCASGCCEKLKNVCRNALALTTGTEFCKNGFTPQFDGPACSNSGVSTTAAGNTSQTNVDLAPTKGTGTQFVTGACQVDSNCASGCCEKLKNVCRNALALTTGTEFCKNGFTPQFDGPACSNSGVSTTAAGNTSQTNVDLAPTKGTGTQFISGTCQVDSNCASGCCEKTKKVCRNALALKTGVEFCQNGFSPVF